MQYTSFTITSLTTISDERETSEVAHLINRRGEGNVCREDYSVVRFDTHTLLARYLYPLEQGLRALSRLKQWSQPLKRSPVAGGRSEAGGRAITAFN
jgi:hypothetical protein